MPSKLTVQNAEIRTASVEIKTLTVSGKQVTLAVFRQLFQKPLLTDDGRLAGEPWGIVNYHPEPKACSGIPHRHVVWQDGSELRRSVVVDDVDWHLSRHNGPRHELYAVGAKWIDSVVLDHLTDGTNYFSDGNDLVIDIEKTWEPGRIEGEVSTACGVLDLSASRVAVECARALAVVRRKESDDWPSNPGDYLEAVAPLSERVASFGGTTDELFAEMNQLAEFEAARRQRFADGIAQVAALPHLFIAV